MSYQPPPVQFDCAQKEVEDQPLPQPLGLVTGVPLAMGSKENPFDSMHVAGGGMPPPLPFSVPITANTVGRTVTYGVARDTDFTDCELRDVHLVGGYIRNCRIFGGAFEDCTFKSCALHHVHHCYECKLDDCSVEPNDTTVLVDCTLIRCETASAGLRDCTVKR